MSKTDHITRKDMKEPDRFQRAATRAASWVAARRRNVVLVGAVAVGVAVIVAVLAATQARKAEEAGAAAADLLEAMGGEISSVPLPGLPGPFYASDDARQRAVIGAADAILERYSGTGAAALAALAKGDAHLRLGEWDAARSAYERFLAAAEKGDSLRFGALEGIALAEEGKGDLEGAARSYERLGREDPNFADRADLGRARVLAAAGKTAEAREILSKFGEKHAASILTPEASERLARLGGQ